MKKKKGSVRQRSNTTWEIYFDIGKDENGKRKKFTKSGFNSEEEAIKALDKALDEYYGTGSVFKESNLSVAQYLRYYMDNYVKLSCRDRTCEVYEEIITKHIIPELGNYHLKNLTTHRVQLWLDGKYKEGYAKKTIEGFHSILKNAMKMAVYPWQFIKENPCDYVILKYQFDYKKERKATRDDLEKVLTLLKDENYEYWILFMTCWLTGMRRSELLGLTWDNIDLNNKVIYVRQQQQYLKGGNHSLVKPKSKSGVRDIVIGDTLVEILKDHKKFVEHNGKEKQFVMINTKGDWMKKHNVANILAKIRERLNFNLGLHDLRHLHATVLCQENANIKGIQQRLGHGDIQTTLSIYVRATDEIKKNTANIFESVL